MEAIDIIWDYAKVLEKMFMELSAENENLKRKIWELEAIIEVYEQKDFEDTLECARRG